MSEPKKDDAHLVYVLLHTPTGEFFKEQNLYLGVAVLSNIDDAALLPLDEAESAWRRMNERTEWQIWSTRLGLRLGSESKRHIVREQRDKLLAQLKTLPDETSQKAYDEPGWLEEAKQNAGENR